MAAIIAVKQQSRMSRHEFSSKKQKNEYDKISMIYAKARNRMVRAFWLCAGGFYLIYNGFCRVYN